LIDPFHAHRNRPIRDHLADYLAFIASEGATSKHVAETKTGPRPNPTEASIVVSRYWGREMPD
jgi:hypothetical protein